MKVTLRMGGASYRAVTPPPGVEHAEVDGAACPQCAASPLLARGTGIRETTRDSYVADAKCVACGEVVGTLVAVVSTIFGIEEDERVLCGRARVY